MRERNRHAASFEKGGISGPDDHAVRPGLNAPGMARRIFLHKSLVIAGAAAGLAATKHFLPIINTIDMAHAAEAPGGVKNFRFAWISDTHLYPREVNTRFVEKTVRAVDEINALSPPVDFVVIGGDVAQLGDPVELRLGKELLDPLQVKKYYIPGEHDWYLDMGKTFVDLFGASPWTFDHKGVRMIGLDTVSRAPDYWSVRGMTPKERMGHMAGLDNSVTGPWAGLGREQRDWLAKTLRDWPADKPVVIFSHNPLYEYYPNWNFWIRDWREVHDILAPYRNVTNFHGHTHQVLYNEFHGVRSVGMLATAWPWPYAPEGVPKLTRAMVRADPGDHFDGLGWDLMTAQGDKVEHEYMMWRRREHIFADAPWDSGTGDNMNQRLSPRLADGIWTGRYRGTD